MGREPPRSPGRSPRKGMSRSDWERARERARKMPDEEYEASEHGSHYSRGADEELPGAPLNRIYHMSYMWSSDALSPQGSPRRSPSRCGSPGHSPRRSPQPSHRLASPLPSHRPHARPAAQSWESWHKWNSRRNPHHADDVAPTTASGTDTVHEVDDAAANVPRASQCRNHHARSRPIPAPSRRPRGGDGAATDGRATTLPAPPRRTVAGEDALEEEKSDEEERELLNARSYRKETPPKEFGRKGLDLEA